jgi:hypothetical protein
VAWQERRDELRHALAAASDAISRARKVERTARDAVLTALAAARADLRAARAAREADASTIAALSGELDAERTAYAVTRGSVGTLADALTAARAEIAAHKARAAVARAELDAARAAAAAELAEARRETTQVRAELAEARRETTQLRTALAEAHHAPTPRTLDLARAAREQAEAAAAAARRAPEESAQLLANLDAAAAALRASTPPPIATPSTDEQPAGAGPAAPPAAPAADGAAAPDRRAEATPVLDAALRPISDATPAPDAASSANERAAPAATASAGAIVPAPPARIVAASTALVRADAERRLRRALVALAREDGGAAGALLVGLLPAQGAVLPGAFSYDLTVRGVGTFAVFVEGGTARTVRVARRRSRREALFHLSADPLVLAELLAGERDRVRRFRRGARVSGRRRRLSELAPLRSAQLSLADAAKAGARLEPALVYRALPLVIDPEWTRGHRFTVAQRVADQTWHVTARDGLPLRVVERRADAPADATVTMSRAAFDRMLRNEPPAHGDRPQVRGDRDAVAALKRWTDVARGA